MSHDAILALFTTPYLCTILVCVQLLKKRRSAVRTSNIAKHQNSPGVPFISAMDFLLKNVSSYHLFENKMLCHKNVSPYHLIGNKMICQC